MIPKQLVAVAAGIALLATACGSASSSDTSSETSPDTSSQASSGTSSETPAESSSQPAAESDATPVELFSPTETDRPFDLTGGAARSSEEIEVVGGDGLTGFDPRVIEAISVWDTDFGRRTVDASEFLLGIQRIDPRDAIRPIDTPKFEPIAAATWLDAREPGALVQFNDEVRFYPLSILTRHEIVNDRYGDIPVVVSFCPLCNTAVSFDGRVDGKVLRFGVSGLLRKSDLVMWDNATTSLWQQITGEAVVGELAGTQLELILTSIVSYGDALEAFPEALSLSQDTGFGIEYGANPYTAYSSSQSPFLFAEEPDPRFPALSRVVGVNLEGADKAYPFSLIVEERAVNDVVDDVPIAVLWGGDTADALDASDIASGAAIGTGIAFDRRVGDQVLSFSHLDGDRFTDIETGTIWTLLGQAIEGPLAGVQLQTVQHRNEFWFAWASFFPEAPVYSAT